MGRKREWRKSVAYKGGRKEEEEKKEGNEEGVKWKREDRQK